MQRKIVKCESPSIGAAFEREQLNKKSRSAFTWVFVNVVISAFFCSELVFGSVSSYFHWDHPLVWYLVCSFAIWFTISLLVDLYYYLRPLFTQRTVLQSPNQRKLLGIRPSDSGYRLASQQVPQCSTNSTSPSSPAGTVSPPLCSSPQRLVSTPPRSSNNNTPQLSGSTGTNFCSAAVTPDTSLRTSRHSSPSRSPFPPNECITELSTLNQYLTEQEEEEERLHRAGPDGFSPGRTQNSWLMSYRQGYTPPLNVYRVARRSPELSNSRDDDDSGFSSTRAEEIWNKYSITRDDLDFWTENSRKWLCQTILVKLVEQIDDVNDTLCRIGCAELQVGMISLSVARQLAVTKADLVPTFRSIIPYLELSSNQEYVVQRLRELASGGCMGVYRWSSGGQYRGKPWQQDLPADSQLVVHLFCTYLDSRLPADPRFPDGRTFTGLHFLKTPDKPDARKSDLCIYESRLHPPHFKVVIEDEVYDIPKGRNNLFHAIIFFLHHIKINHYGMLGRVNLGMTGVNILCILNKK